MQDPKWPKDWPSRRDVTLMLMQTPRIVRRKLGAYPGIVLDVEHVSAVGAQELADAGRLALLADAVKRGDLSGNLAGPVGKRGVRLLFVFATPVPEWEVMLPATNGAAYLVEAALHRLGIAGGPGRAGFIVNPGAFDPAWRSPHYGFSMIIKIRPDFYTVEELTRRKVSA